MREDNTVSVIQRAVKYYKIPVTKNSVKVTLKSHSYYPAFKSICDALNEWKVEHYPLKYELEEIKDLTTPYIAHFKTGGGRLAFVSEIKNSNITYYESYNSKREADLKEFLEKCSGAVILLNPDERSGEKEYRKKKHDELIGNGILPLAVIILLCFIVITIVNSFASGYLLIKKMQGLLLLTKTLGVILSLLLILHEFEISFSMTDKLCHFNKATNCNTVLNDKASKIFGWIGWADLGFIYFTGGLLFLLQSPVISDYSLMAILSAFSVPYPAFSIYYQGWVLKKWCPLCLGVQLLLVTEFIILLPSFSNMKFSFMDLSGLILIFLVTGLIYCLIIMYFREKMSNEVHFYKYLGFKKNPDIIRTVLFHQQHYDIPLTETSLVFGVKNSPIMITAFLSLNCSHCARAFNKIREILRMEIKTAINIVLLTSDSKILTALYFIYRQNKYDEALELLEKWYNMDTFSRYKITENLCVPEDNEISKEVGNVNYKLYKECNVAGTPTFFINGYRLPNQYDIDDIKYYYEAFTGKDEVLV